MKSPSLFIGAALVSATLIGGALVDQASAAGNGSKYQVRSTDSGESKGKWASDAAFVVIGSFQTQTRAQRLVAEVFELRPSFEWRGLGEIPDSALKIRNSFAAFDAERRFALATRQVADIKSCACPAILRGVKKPTDCKLFGKACTPENPMGSCMVSSEGACAAYWTYRRSAEPAEEIAA